jgi:hypothetical protein
MAVVMAVVMVMASGEWRVASGGWRVAVDAIAADLKLSQITRGDEHWDGWGQNSDSGPAPTTSGWIQTRSAHVLCRDVAHGGGGCNCNPPPTKYHAGMFAEKCPAQRWSR